MPKADHRAPLEDDDDRDDANARQCTDIICCILFVVFFWYWLTLFSMGWDKGSYQKLLGGIDWEGNTCGIKNNTSGKDMSTKKLLYWCVTEDFQVTDGVCVEECPQFSATGPISEANSIMCPGSYTEPKVEDVPHGTGTTVHISMTRELMLMKKVRTDVFPPVAGMYCLPRANLQNAKEMMAVILARGQMSGPAAKLSNFIKGFNESRTVLSFMAFLAIVLSFGFIFTLQHFVKVIVYVIIIFVWLLLAGFTGITAYSTLDPKTNVFCRWELKNCDGIGWTVAIISGCCLLAYTIFLCCERKTLRTTIRSVKKSCKILRDLPTLVLEPVISLLFKMALFIFSVSGLTLLASMGDIVPAEGYFTPKNSGVSISGVDREIDLPNELRIYIGIFIFGWLWLHEFITALGQYAVSHAVVIRQLNADESCRSFPLMTGVLNGIAYHTGTIAFGSFIIGVLRFLTGVCSGIAKQAKRPDGSTNPAVRIACCCCAACLKCLTDVMQSVNEMAYVQCAINGTGYVGSCKHVAVMLIKHADIFVMVHGITKAIRCLGILSVSGLCTFGYYFVTSQDVSGLFEDVIKGSSTVIATSSRMGTVVAVGLITLAISSSFMTTFDMIADSLAYCVVHQQEMGVLEEKEGEIWESEDEDEETTDHHYVAHHR
jgi:hypothetical protein